MATEKEIVWRFAPFDRAGYLQALFEQEEAEAKKNAQEEEIILPRLSQPARTRNTIYFEKGISVKGLFPVAALPENAPGYDQKDPNLIKNVKLGGYAIPAQIVFKDYGLVVRPTPPGKGIAVPAEGLQIETKSVNEYFVRIGIFVGETLFEGKATYVAQPKPKEVILLQKSSL